MSPSNSMLKTLISLSKLFLSFSLLLHTAIADDGVFMSKLAKSLSPTPSGWTTATTFCSWTGVKCDDSNRVTSINVPSKSLTGTIPSDLNSLSQLTSISFQSNSLAGALPSLANLSNLQSVFLSSNNFTSIPDGCFQGLTSLQKLSMTGNTNLKPWSFPSELTQSLNLVELDLGQTNLIGSLPDIFSPLFSLQNLSLAYNNLTGDLPNSFSGSGIQNLWLNNQQDGFGFTGSLDLLSSMSHLTQVWFQKNKFTGPIPDLTNCTNLFDLQLRDNQLTGGILTRQSITLCEGLTVSSFCRRRLSTVLVRLKFAEHLKEAVTYIEQGHVRVGPNTVTDPAFLATRNQEDFVTWVDRLR